MAFLLIGERLARPAAVKKLLPEGAMSTPDRDA
jgi:hypothetical protein